MGVIADRKKTMTVKCFSPDASIGGRCGKDRNLTALEFRPGSYRHYTEPELEYQLAEVLTRLAKGYERAWSQILLDAGRIPITNAAQVDQEAWKKYLTELHEITVVGTSPGKNIRFKTKGRVEFKCRLAKGVLDRLPEEEFAAQAIAASADLMRKFQFEILLLKDECWGLGVPKITEARKNRKQQQGRA